MRRILVICLMLTVLLPGFTFIVYAEENPLKSTSTYIPIVTAVDNGEVTIQCGPWVPVTDD